MSECLYQVTLPWPPRELNPNFRGRWQRIKAGKRYRNDCHNLTLAQLGTQGLPFRDGRIDVSLDLYPPNKRSRDDDNAEAAFKPGRDGVAQALRVDDRRFRVLRYLHDWSPEFPDGGVVLGFHAAKLERGE